MSEWRTYAARLADQLVASGDLTSPAWYAAIGETPRHVLIPTVYEAQPQPYDSLSDARLNTADHPELVYSTTTLVTTVVPNEYGSLVPVSSSTKPDLMVRMLETLDIRKGQRVLEIGTGTGYNAALLAHHLGDDNVFSVDIDDALVDVARRRLAGIGRHPRLAARDGARGWPDHAPYDRIICTCAVRRIPWAWYEQLTPDGQLLVDFKPRGGNLVLLRRESDRLAGRFTARYAAFMIMRRGDDHDQKPGTEWQRELPMDRERTTTTPAEPPSIVGFLRSVTTAAELRRSHTFDEQTRRPTAVKLVGVDGSCCEVAITSGDDGPGMVREGGPTPVWAQVERAHDQWRDWGEPGWNRFGVTVDQNSWTAWLDEPDNVVSHAPRW